MGSLTSVLDPVLKIGSVVSSIGQFAKPLASSSVDTRQLDAQLQKTTQDVATKKQQNLLDYNAQETERQRKLRAALATSRAEAGAAGLGSSASSETVRQNIVEESDIARQENTAGYNLTNQSLDNSLASARRMNLLQKQQVQQNGVFDSLSSIF